MPAHQKRRRRKSQQKSLLLAEKEVNCYILNLLVNRSPMVGANFDEILEFKFSKVFFKFGSSKMFSVFEFPKTPFWTQCGQIHKFTWKSTPNGISYHMLKPEIKTLVITFLSPHALITMVNEICTNSSALWYPVVDLRYNSTCVLHESKHH